MKQPKRNPETPAIKTKPKPSKKRRRPIVNGERPSPFELAQTAIALCQLHGKDLQLLPPSHYFDEATDLWTKAQNYLAPAYQERLRLTGVEFMANFLQTPEANRAAGRPIPFEWLLGPVDQPSSSEKVPKRLCRKKPRTLVGTITTKGGLEKAVRRWFPKGDAARIIQAQAMMYPEYQRLLSSQREVIAKRAARRVKGRNAERSQPS